MLKLPSINNVFRNKSTSLGSIRYKISDYQIQVSANQILSLSAIFDNSCILSCRLLCRISVIVHIKWSVSVDDSHHKVLESCMTETNLFLMVSWTQGLEFSMFFKAASSLRLYYRTEAMEKGHAKIRLQFVALKRRCSWRNGSHSEDWKSIKREIIDIYYSPARLRMNRRISKSVHVVQSYEWTDKTDYWTYKNHNTVAGYQEISGNGLQIWSTEHRESGLQIWSTGHRENDLQIWSTRT